MAKSVKVPSTTYGTGTTAPLQLVHSDLCGPMGGEGYNHHRYVCTLIDDFSRLTMIGTLHTKDSAGEAVLEMIKAMENQFGSQTIKIETI
jgi:hypothetical protein